jgi:DNA repair protein RadA/Sms
MAKTKSVFYCQNCGFESAKWQGKCPSCDTWNSFEEQVITSNKRSNPAVKSLSREAHKPIRITEVKALEHSRFLLPDAELMRVLGGGLVPGSLILVAGEPGIGKSTLMLQTAMRYEGKSVLYVSGEESSEQITQRAERLGPLNSNCFIMTITDPSIVLAEAEKLNPDFIVIDSAQTLHADWVESSPGSISQIRESTAMLMRYAKTTHTAIFLIGHITKDGSIAGPKVLEHMVDAVTVFEGDQQHLFRLLRCTKNRFGSTNELGIYRMESTGLSPVENPSELLLSGQAANLSGSATAAIVEGIRPLMIEVQALVSTAVYGTPQRSATGFDVRRLHMLLAVLEKRCGFRLGAKDVFLNIAGGMKVNDPSIDLAVVSAVLSSSEDLTLPQGTCFAAEVGLSGEIRPVTRIEQRITEAGKLGFEKIFVSIHHRDIKVPKGLEVLKVASVQDLLRNMFG